MTFAGMEQTEVLIAGAGPVGMTLALDLARRGVRSIIVERNATTTVHPRMDITNARTMELFRGAGIAEALRKVAVPDGHCFDVSWITHRESREPELGHRIRLRVSGFTDRGARAGRALDDDPVTYHPTTAPGARLPSVFLRDGTSLHEHLGQWFTVLVLGW